MTMEPSRLIYLDRSRTERAFSDRESVWEVELRRIERLLSEHLLALEDWNKQDQSFGERRERKVPRRRPGRAPLLSIAIFGTYGAGKSSLLKTLVDRVRHHEAPFGTAQIGTLPVLEPNLRASDEHFLYSFLATALEEDLRRSERPEGHGRGSAAGTYRLSVVQQVFQEVSEYLQVIDPGQGSQEYDPLGLSLERLERHTSGFLLHEKLQEMIDQLATSLGGGPGSVLLMPVDDADQSHENLVATLDTYRRYLMHPRLVPVFTFTGRLAEELLRVHFAQELRAHESHQLSERLREASTALDITEQLAYQYLVKLFPIRNRIRLGPAPARVQRSQYVAEGAATSKQRPVWELLEVASIFLFGHPEWPITPRIRLLFRPATLRRQMQILDAIQSSHLEYFVAAITRTPKQIAEERWKSLASRDGGESVPDWRALIEFWHNESPESSWGTLFQNTSWSVLNVHRDVLREVGLHVEDLYSWTPRNLRRVVLEAILSLSPDRRQKLLKRWRYQAQDRRGQVLSLLVAEAFRPPMAGEEPSGDDPDRGKPKAEAAEIRPQPADLYSFPVRQGVLWVLDAWMGFYLPFILAADHSAEAGPAPRDDHDLDDRVQSVGWTLRNGPEHAVDKAVDQRLSTHPGIAIFETRGELEELSGGFSRRKGSDRHFHLWCYHGYRDRRPWVAVSLWRGLGLLGQIIEDFERLRASVPDLNDKGHIRRITKLLQNHAESGRRPGLLPPTDAGPAWPKLPDEGKVSPSASYWAGLAEELWQWINAMPPGARIDPLLLESADRLTQEAGREADGDTQQEPGRETNWVIRASSLAWPNSFVRLVHGDALLGEFWPKLEGAASEGPRTDQWTGLHALGCWLQSFCTYLDKPIARVPEAPPYDTIRDWLAACPLITPWLHATDRNVHEDALEDEQTTRDLKETFGKLTRFRGDRPPRQEQPQETAPDPNPPDEDGGNSDEK